MCATALYYANENYYSIISLKKDAIKKRTQFVKNNWPYNLSKNDMHQMSTVFESCVRIIAFMLILQSLLTGHYIFLTF